MNKNKLGTPTSTDVKQAIYFIREAWQEVTSQTIENYWRKHNQLIVLMSECLEKIREAEKKSKKKNG